MPNPPLGQFQIQPTVTYVDRPEISETFADSCARVSVEGFNAKLEFIVTRMDDPKPPAPPTGKAMTTCRLVLPLPGVLALHAKLTQIINALQAQGVLSQIAQFPEQSPGKPN
jgi:hypothetical protein